MRKGLYPHREKVRKRNREKASNIDRVVGASKECTVAIMLV